MPKFFYARETISIGRVNILFFCDPVVLSIPKDKTYINIDF